MMMVVAACKLIPMKAAHNIPRYKTPLMIIVSIAIY
jgi:hypothetical protein